MIYTLSGDNSDLSGGADFNKALVESGATNTTVSFSIATNSTETSYGFTPSGNPGADGATGNYTILARITTGNNNGRLSISLSRVNSSGTVQSTSSATSEQTTSAGTQTHTLTSVNLGTWAAGDRLRVNYIFRNANTMSAQTVAIGTGTSNDTVDVPWDLAGPAQDLTQASRLDNAQTFYAATLTQLPPAQSLTPGLFTNTQSFYAAEVIQPGPPQNLAQTEVFHNTSALWDDFTWDSFVWDGQVFYPASISQPDTVNPPLVVNNQTFYAATITTGAVVLQPSLLTNAQTFYGPTVTRGAVTLAPGLLTNNQAFYAATVTRGAVTLLPSRLDNAQSFYGATITRGAVTLQPGLLTNGQTFYGATVVLASTPLLPSLVVSTQSFYGPSVTTGPATVLPGLFTNGQSFYAATVSTGSVTLLPTRYDNAQTFFGASVASGSATLQPALFTNAQVFYGASITTGAVGVAPPRIENGQTFYGPVVQAGAVQLLPALLENGQSFFAAQVQPGAVTLAPALLENTSELFAPSVLQLDFRYSRPSSDVAQGAWAPSSGSDLYAMLNEVDPEDADYIATTAASTCEMRLRPVINPQSALGHVLRYRARSSTGSTLIARLKQGSTLIAEETHAALDADWAEYSMTLTEAQAGAITDYTDLRVELEAV